MIYYITQNLCTVIDISFHVMQMTSLLFTEPLLPDKIFIYISALRFNRSRLKLKAKQLLVLP